MGTITAKNLVFLRKRRGLKQAEIEALCGIKQRNWSNYENGTTEPDITSLIATSKLFGTPVDWLIKVDLEQNVHLLSKLPLELEDLKSTSFHTSNSTSNVQNEGQKAYGNDQGKGTDLLILHQLEVLTGEVKKIAENLQQKGI